MHEIKLENWQQVMKILDRMQMMFAEKFEDPQEAILFFDWMNEAMGAYGKDNWGKCPSLASNNNSIPLVEEALNDKLKLAKNIERYFSCDCNICLGAK
jgi:hypothetical protein